MKPEYGWAIVMVLFSGAITFFLASINFRLGVLDEIKEELKEKVGRDECKLQRRACSNHMEQEHRDRAIA